MQTQTALHHTFCSIHDTYNDAIDDVVTVQYSSVTKQPSTAAGQGDTCQIVRSHRLYWLYSTAPHKPPSQCCVTVLVCIFMPDSAKEALFTILLRLSMFNHSRHEPERSRTCKQDDKHRSELQDLVSRMCMDQEVMPEGHEIN